MVCNQWMGAGDSSDLGMGSVGIECVRRVQTYLCLVCDNYCFRPSDGEYLRVARRK